MAARRYYVYNGFKRPGLIRQVPGMPNRQSWTQVNKESLLSRDHLCLICYKTQELHGFGCSSESSEHAISRAQDPSCLRDSVAFKLNSHVGLELSLIQSYFNIISSSSESISQLKLVRWAKYLPKMFLTVRNRHSPLDLLYNAPAWVGTRHRKIRI